MTGCTCSSGLTGADLTRMVLDAIRRGWGRWVSLLAAGVELTPAASMSLPLALLLRKRRQGVSGVTGLPQLLRRPAHLRQSLVLTDAMFAVAELIRESVNARIAHMIVLLLQNKAGVLQAGLLIVGVAGVIVREELCIDRKQGDGDGCRRKHDRSKVQSVLPILVRLGIVVHARRYDAVPTTSAPITRVSPASSG